MSIYEGLTEIVLKVMALFSMKILLGKLVDYLMFTRVKWVQPEPRDLLKKGILTDNTRASQDRLTIMNKWKV